MPDVNVWLALVSRRHVHSELCAAWLNSLDQSSEVHFCRVTQMGLLRLLTNEAVMREDVLSSQRAWRVYDSVREDERIQFADEPLLTEDTWRGLSSLDRPAPKVWTDAYLAAFAQAGHMRLVTMDQAIVANVDGALLLTEPNDRPRVLHR